MSEYESVLGYTPSVMQRTAEEQTKRLSKAYDYVVVKKTLTLFKMSGEKIPFKWIGGWVIDRINENLNEREQVGFGGWLDDATELYKQLAIGEGELEKMQYDWMSFQKVPQEWLGFIEGCEEEYKAEFE